MGSLLTSIGSSYVPRTGLLRYGVHVLSLLMILCGRSSSSVVVVVVVFSRLFFLLFFFSRSRPSIVRLPAALYEDDVESMFDSLKLAGLTHSLTASHQPQAHTQKSKKFK